MKYISFCRSRSRQSSQVAQRYFVEFHSGRHKITILVCRAISYKIALPAEWETVSNLPQSRFEQNSSVSFRKNKAARSVRFEEL